MKKAILVLAVAILYSFTYQKKKDFEGIIKFKVEYRDKTGKTSSEQIKQFMGDEQTYYLKKDKYKSTLNGMAKMQSFYNGNDTLYLSSAFELKLYYQLVNEEQEEKVVSHEFTNVTEVIAGIKCKLVRVKTNKGMHHYYYSDEVTIDPKYYENHKMGLWNYLMKITNGGISIKSISDLNDSYHSIEVLSIERKKLNDAIFKKPNLPLEKMPED